MLHICTSDPRLLVPGGSPRHIRGKEAVLLRVLLLSSDPASPESSAPRVPVDVAAAVMGVAKTSVGKYVGCLRDALGANHPVLRIDGAIQFGGPPDEVDAAVVRSLFNQIQLMVDEESQISTEMAEQALPLLTEIVALYHGSPAMGLDAIDPTGCSDPVRRWITALDDVASEWVDLWLRVQLLKAECLLASGSKADGKRAAADLLKIARTKDPPVEVWLPLLKSAHMSRDPRVLKLAWDLTKAFHEDEGLPVPDELGALAPTPARAPSDASPPRRPGDPAGVSHDANPDPRIELAELLGISTASALKLRGSILEPAECIARTERRLFFSGILASKWVMDAALRFEFVNMLDQLENLDDEPGDVRFLIIDPSGAAYSRLHQMRGGRLSDESVPHLRRLSAKYQCFEVRVVDALPAFRIIVIDDDVVSISPYALEEEPYATSRLGWSAPHVMLDPLAPFPLASAFRLYFEERWNAAKPLPR